jgi:hypothetical protein
VVVTREQQIEKPLCDVGHLAEEHLPRFHVVARLLACFLLVILGNLIVGKRFLDGLAEIAP